MKKLKVLFMFFAVLLGLAGSFAFRTPTHKHKFTGSTLGLGVVVLTTTNPTTTGLTLTASQFQDLAGLTEGDQYDCDMSESQVCTISVPAGISTYFNSHDSKYHIPANDWSIIEDGEYQNPIP